MRAAGHAVIKIYPPYKALDYSASVNDKLLFLFITVVLDKAANEGTVCGELLHTAKGHKVS